MVSELGECIPCFPDNRGRFGATSSDLGNGMRKFVKAKKDLISPEPVRHLNMCVLSQNPTYIQYIFKYKIHTYVHIMVFALFTIYSQVCVIHNMLWWLSYSQYIMVFVLFTIYYSVCVIHNILWCL